jgi:hypothetical protein
MNEVVGVGWSAPEADAPLQLNSGSRSFNFVLFQSNFGPVQGRDKWRAPLQATPDAALRVLYCAPSKQRVGGSNPSGRATYLRKAFPNGLESKAILEGRLLRLDFPCCRAL